MINFISNIIYSFLISFGVIVGASAFGGLAAIINNQPPLKTIIDLAGSIKIWAVATALGGTFSTFEVLDEGVFKGEIRLVIKQMVYILVALLGANAGFYLVKLLHRCGQIWGE
ncbi:YtrH family sporulation protein [Clostridium cylindrosporum]|uniref:Sporulation protein YtrH n=1 Tax=Clostridium cylindrosporum DSM 605 TaxID=1121307 RepID=A0A0J8DBS2_CLOCY|nr:YtrH family sporulation protein [Clostridium cylindrosporum]KMT23312.1 sporulation protein YtrH [Clostridium cylindrosporum DSM 605]